MALFSTRKARTGHGWHFGHVSLVEKVLASCERFIKNSARRFCFLKAYHH